MSKSLSFYNLTGGLNTAQDLATINSTTNRTESPNMVNIEYYKLGGIQTMKGNKQVGNTLLSNAENEGDILCGIEYVYGNELILLIATREGIIYKYDKDNNNFTQVSAFNEKKTSNDDRDWEFYENERIYAVPYNNGVVFVNGNEALFYHDEKTELNGPWTPKLRMTDGGQTLLTTFHPVVIASYKGRLFMGANNSSQQILDTSTQEYIDNTDYKDFGMLFYSGVGLGTEEIWEESPNLGEDAGAFMEFFEDSSNFTALSTWAEYLVIHKQQNTYLLDGNNDLAAEWELKPYSEYTIASQQSYVIANNCYYSYIAEAGGIYPLLNRSLYNNTYQGGDISYKIRDSFEYLDVLNLDKIYCTYQPKKKYVMFYVPTLDGNGSNNCYIYDINTKSWLLRRVPQYVTCAFRYDNNVYIGVRYVKDGVVTTKLLKEFSGKSFDGTPIDFTYLTPPFMWGGGTNKTTTKEFRCKLVNEKANHFYIESLRNGTGDTKEQRLVKNINDNLDGLVWDVGYNLSDRLYDEAYKEVDFYQYTYNADNKTYYTKVSLVNPTIPLDDIIIYKTAVPREIDGETRYILQNKANYYSNFIKDELAQVSGEPCDVVKPIENKSYAWNERVGELCYRYHDSTNKLTYLAWVNQQTGLCTTNLKLTDWYQWYGLHLDSNADSRFRVSETVLNDINSKLNKTKTFWYTTDYPNDMQYYQIANTSSQQGWKSDTWPITLPGIGTRYIYAGLYTMWDYGEYPDDGLNWVIRNVMTGYIDRRQTNTWKNEKKIPDSAWKNNPDTVKGNKKNNEVPTGTKPLSITKGTKSIGEQASINITTKYKGKSKTITLTRYPKGDLGTSTASNTNYYTKQSTGSNVIVYRDSECLTQYGTGSISGKVLTMNNIQYDRYEQADGTYTTYEYYNYGEFQNETVINGLEVIYEYPPENITVAGETKLNPVYKQTLTDTIWDFSEVDEPYIMDNRPPDESLHEDIIDTGNTYEDASINTEEITGDAWLYQGYTTKRMLLPNQYFETIQFRFTGGGQGKDGKVRKQDNICISGFEVEGVQLVETPWS